MENLYLLSILSIFILFFFLFFKDNLLNLPLNLSQYLKLKKRSIFLENIFYFDKDLKLAILKIEKERYYILFNANVINIIKKEKIEKDNGEKT